MRKLPRGLFAPGILLAVLLAAGVAGAQSGEPKYRPGEVIIKFKANASPSQRKAILSELGAAELKPLGRLDIQHAHLSRMTVEKAIARFKKHPKVEYIEPNYILHTFAVPKDPRFGELWGLRNLGQTGGTPGADITATAAWDVTTGSDDVVVGDIDTGADYTHPDLAANIWTNPGEIPGNGLDDDSNGFVDDVHGWDFINNDNDPMDDHFHGTHTAGTIGAVGNNGLGVVGVSWRIKIMPLKFLSAAGSGSLADAVRAIDYATLMHVRLTSNSWGGGGYSQAMRDAIHAAGDAGILFVAAAGNDGRDTDLSPVYPADYDEPNIISVAATDHNDQLAFFSNYGVNTVDLGAPGVDVLSTMPAGNYGILSGTSMATPHVSGALGLVFAHFPGIDGASAKALLLSRVDAIPSLTGRVGTGGRLNALLPIAAADSILPAAITDLAAIDVNGTRITLQWTAPGDDGNLGTVGHYEVRYSTAPIDTGNFGAATRVQGPLTPLPAGATEHLQVRGLQFATSYYFAVKAFDELGNSSPLSNVPVATTLGPPDISVSPSSLSASLLTGQSETRILTLTNSGPSELNYDITVRSGLVAGSHARVLRAFGSSGREPDPTPINPPPFKAGTYNQGHVASRGPIGPAGIRITNLLSGGAMRVLLLQSRSDVSEIRSLLQSFPDIQTVDVFDGSFTSPTLADLATYDAVIVIANSLFGDPVATGNALADYADTGGGVILTLASFIGGYHVQGRFLSDGYMPFDLGSGPIGGSSLGTFDASHPIMQGVAAATGDLLGNVTLSAGAQLVASWSNGQPCVATKLENVAAVNVFVAFSGFWTGDIPLILHNAVLWSSKAATWLSADPFGGVVPSGASLEVVVRLDAAGVDGGDYDARLMISSEDPDESEVQVPAHLHVTGAPDIAVQGELVTVESDVPYFTDGAFTSHQLPVTMPPPAGGTLELVADGDYGDLPEFATVTVEGTVLGDAGRTGADCAPAQRSFEVSSGDLAAWAADRRVDVTVQNSPEVNVFCLANHHTVRLKYEGPADRLDFGSVFVAGYRDITLEVKNLGSDVLNVTSIASDQPQFVPSASSMTLAPRTGQSLRMRFTPPSPTSFSATLRIMSNDPDLALIVIPLMGRGIEPPEIGVDPNSLEATLPEHGTGSQTLHLLNTGNSPLDYSLRLLPHVTAAAVTPFTGLTHAAGAASNNPPPHGGGGGAGLAPESEPRFVALASQFELLHPSPVRLTCVVEDPVNGLLYGQEEEGLRFYRYRSATDTWEPLANAPAIPNNNGGATLLNGKVYTSYVGGSDLGVYTIATNSWSTVANPIDYGTGNITSDGSQYLYLASGPAFIRYDPVTTATAALASPPFYFELWGSLRFFDGFIYGHEGNGTMGFAKYEIASNTWTLLASLPQGGVLGAAIDRSQREYVAYGPYGGQLIYRYSIDSGTWSVSTNPYFLVLDGGMGWLPSPVPGIYFVQGEAGTGFAREVSIPEFLTVNPSSGSVPAGGSVDLDVRFDAGDLPGGNYTADLAISSNDPVTPLLDVLATLNVVGEPNILVGTGMLTLESVVDYDTDGARTSHTLAIPVTPGGGGTIELSAEGDYGDFPETATAIVEGVTLGSVGRTGFDCSPATGNFSLSAGQLATFAADGHLDVEVQNSFDVNAFCPINRHTVRLTYAPRADLLDFGPLFVGLSRDLTVTVQNAGSLALVVGTIASDRPEFEPLPASMTVPPRSTRSLTVRFTPSAVSSFSGTLRIESNDPDTPVIQIAMTGAGLQPPVVGVNPASLTSTLPEHQSEVQNLQILNTGHSNLDFALSVRVGAPGATVSTFAGLSAGNPTASNNPPRHPPAPAMEPPTTSGVEPLFRALTGEFQLLAPSPSLLTCIVEDPVTGSIYAQDLYENQFRRYDAATNTWQNLATAPITAGIEGGAALLGQKIYTSYILEPTALGVYDIPTNTWATLSHSTSLPFATGDVASDGSRYLYFAAALDFYRFDPVANDAVRLASPPFPFELWGGLEYLDGVIYGHQGNGGTGFARYDVSLDQWTLLAPVPGAAVLGSAIDPVQREYVAYGPYFGQNLYRYSIDTGIWSVATIPFFGVGDGGMGWLPGPVPGIYFSQGEFGVGFARMVGSPPFVSVTPTRGSVPPSGSASVQVRFDSGDLLGGTYHGQVVVSSNDPVTPQLGVPVTLSVTAHPDILVTGEEVQLVSTVQYISDGALTVHHLSTPVNPAGGGTIEIVAEGDFGDFNETATLSVEGTVLGSVGQSGIDCFAASGTFTLSAAQLSALIADGRVDAEVQNTTEVNTLCLRNQHTVRLNYDGPASSLDFGSIFAGLTRELSVNVRNRGGAALTVTSISSDGPQFIPVVSTMTVAPRSSRPLTIRFAPAAPGAFSATLSIASNDPDQSKVTVGLTGRGLVPPGIEASPSSLSETLYPGETASRTLTLRNPGGSELVWNASVQASSVVQVLSESPKLFSSARAVPTKAAARYRPESPNAGDLYVQNPPDAGSASLQTFVPEAASEPSLEQVLANLNAFFGTVTSAIPVRFDFTEGDSGFAIDDGGNDMYDSGNYLSTNNGGPVAYTNGVIVPSGPWFGGRYFTRKYPGLFVLAAELGGISDFTISGNLGADGAGNVDGAILQTIKGGRSYRGFVKRVFNTSNPSVNHLVIVVDNPAAGQSFPFFTDDDFHRATGLSPSARLYYLLYAGQFGSYIDNSATQNIMNRFIDAAGLLPSWLTVDPRSGTVPPGESVNLALRLDATGLEARDYQGVMAFVSNVPTMPELDVPVSLHVRGRPALGLRESSINFGTVFVGYQATRPLTILNLGTEPLVVSSMSADRGDYSAVPPSDSIAPRDSAIVQVRFAPSTDGDRTSTMTIYSNEPGYPHGATLRGAGLFPPDIATSPNVIEGFASPGQQITRIFQICNQGGSPLTFTLRISEPALSALGTTSPGGARAASLEPSRSPLRAPARGAPAAGLQSEPDLAPIAGVHAPEAALQGFDYSFLDSDMPGGPTFNWVDITGVGTRLPLTGDESIYAGVPIGFDFPFYGNKFNTLNVNVNGWVSFTSTLAPGNLNQRLPDSRSVVPKNLLAVFWDDMMFGPVERAYAYNDGGRFILSFEGISREGSAGGYTFQAILYPDGQITYQYLQLGQNVTGATVGIQNDTGTEGLTVVHNAPYLHGGLAVGISPPTSLTWARISPASGTVGVGGCADIQITLDAGLLGPGDYVAVLQVPSNDPDERLEFHDVVFHVQSPIPGDLDIDPNSLNPGRTGRWITTYLELPAPFHVTDLDLPTVRLNGSIAPDTSHQTVGDHDYDGIPDLTLKFDRGATQQILPEADSVDIVVTGQMTSGGLFTSNDRIRLIRHTVLAPNGGERLTAGGSATIRWSVPSTWHPDYAALFYSRDDGATWAPIAQNVPGLSFIWSVPDQVCTAARVRVNLFDADGLIAHDSSDGPFSIEPAALAVEPGEVQAFALRQNTPNPFRVSTRIEFDLPVASRVRLKIFDTAGRAVHTLVDGLVPAGRHGVRWDGRSGSGQSLHPGVYLLRIETPGFTATRRMVLID